MGCLRIEWDHGTMLVNLDEFFFDCSIRRTKKLLELIEFKSTQPENVNKVKEYVENTRKEYSSAGGPVYERICELKAEIAECEERIKRLTYLRAHYRKSSPDWKEYNQKLKEVKESLKVAKECFRTEDRKLKSYIKSIKFFDKLLSEVFPSD